MSKLIITMCGTSAIFECLHNWKKRVGGKMWRDREELVGALKQEQEDDKDAEYKYLKERVIETLQPWLKRYDPENGKYLENLSAELASLLAMERDKEIGPIVQGDKVVLCHSDTIEGRLCAEANKEVINGQLKEWDVGIEQIDDLKIAEAEKFVKSGLKNLRDKINKLKESKPKRKIFLNITGGYKGTIPMLSRLAIDDKNIPLVYLFENNREIIRMVIGGDDPAVYTTNPATGKTEKSSLGYWNLRNDE
ncbi:MAG: putative CRISPR-associated protein [Candidatus Scalindua rubra]|uniref:CRISPR-associated protein n=1 Tax=Candidatus Scalindua brodae TaxID=237368 RepID=A0A0B0EPD0_9BACT|nr:MAG: CRISPR-associated protein [Candidatus Scalindua brodae]MBZ0108764.1 putative CRISPR-associated protein [Candidatus Scalindua rubra]TWU30939.1 CRISPR-associated protein [Candidatus Brocadiaceae bacterium S225]